MKPDNRETVTGGSTYRQDGFICNQHVHLSDSALFYHNLGRLILILLHTHTHIYVRDPPIMRPIKLIFMHDELEAIIGNTNILAM
jgi:hypothetical protein